MLAEWTEIHEIDEVLVKDYKARLALVGKLREVTRVCGGPCVNYCSVDDGKFEDAWDDLDASYFERATTNIHTLNKLLEKLHSEQKLFGDGFDRVSFRHSRFWSKGAHIDCFSNGIPEGQDLEAVQNNLDLQLAKQDQEIIEIIGMAKNLGVESDF